MQTVTMEAVCLVGTRTRSYNGFTAKDGREIPAGSTHFVYVVDPNALGEPTEVKVKADEQAALRAKGFGTLLTVEASAFAKGNRVEWQARSIHDHDTGEVLRAVS